MRNSVHYIQTIWTNKSFGDPFDPFQAYSDVRFFRSSHQRCSVTKGVLRNFAKFTGKHLCQGFFFNKVAGLSPKCCGISKNKFFYRILPDDCFYFLKRKMKKRYGDMIIFTDMQGETDVVCLKETASIILKDTWHNKLKQGCKI